MRVLVVFLFTILVGCGSTGTTEPGPPAHTQDTCSAICPSGPAGAQGEQGPRGVAGSKGEQGVQGSPGSQGASGPAGAKGDVGPTGQAGPQGAQGPAGAPGAQGPKGDTGTINKAQIYIVTVPASMIPNTVSTVTALCADTNDVLLNGGCFLRKSNVNQNGTAQNYDVLNTNSQTQHAGWTCQFSIGAVAPDNGSAFAMCLTQ